MGNNGEEVARVPLRMRCVSINCLPDELLVHILSFLTTKEAGSTSVLSKKWRTLFAYSPNLHFNDSTFLIPKETIMERADDILEDFRSFVDKTLALQGGALIKKFSLKCGEKHEKVHIDRWISSVMARGVSEVDLGFYDCIQCLLPTSLFMSKTMVKLTLGTQLNIDNIPSDTSLLVLKVLFLDSVCFGSQELCTVFLAACPALEDLTIHHKSFPGMPYVISSKTIKRLSITYVDCAVWVNFLSFISLDTPNVVDLYYSDFALPQYLHCNLNSLAKATLDLNFLNYEDPEEPVVTPDVTELINGIRNVKILDLSSSTVEVISMCCKGGLPMFKNLVSLVLSGSEHPGWKTLLPLLLERSPNLKSLVLSGIDLRPYDHRFWRIRIPSRNQIKFLLILHYQGTANEVKNIGHFLLNMQCLELVRVCVSPAMNDSEKMQIAEDLLKLPTASSNLTMEVE